MKGKFKSQSGETIEVLVFDSENKIAYATVSSSGESKWYAESEYSTWSKDGDGPIVEVKKEAAIEQKEEVTLVETTHVTIKLKEPETPVVEETKEYSKSNEEKKQKNVKKKK